MTGWSLWDDFIREGSAGDFGETRLTSHPIGSGATPSGQAPSANTEIGILRLTTALTSTTNEGGSLGIPTSPGVFASGLPGGLRYWSKLRLINTTNIEAWSGFVEDHRRIYDGGAFAFVGFWAAGGGNWYGVVYDGMSWQAVDLGELADTTWRNYEFEVVPKGMLNNDESHGIQFYKIRADMPHNWGPEREKVGDLVQIPTLPAMTLAALGAVTTDGATPERRAEVDYIGVGGPGRR